MQKKPRRKIAQKNKKVAVISLCVPSMESLEIVEKQIEAMSRIEYPHDSWILDEGGSSGVKKLAKKYHVRYFSRKGIKKYNQPFAPFQRKTKAGNVNAWLDHVKKRKYDFFVQLDIDHIPTPRYLHKTLGYFRNENVAWVQAPSVYGNLQHWTARGAAEQELVLQGPLQMGFYGFSKTPFIIGSHCTYRMNAIREIGGFQPTRAEDHLDTVYLSAKGYEGVYLPEVIAVGNGPDTLQTYLKQQFAWAYSMFQVLLYHTPKVFNQLSLKCKLQFLFAQTWYPLWSLTYVMLFFGPLMSIIFSANIANTDPRETLIHFAPLYVCAFLVWFVATPLMQPKNVLLTWRGVILHAVRWPVIVQALFSVLFHITKPYMITPKGKKTAKAPAIQTYVPFLWIGLISSLIVIGSYTSNRDNVPKSQMVFGAMNASFMLTICVIDIFLRLKNTRPTYKELRRYWVQPMVSVLVLALITSASGIASAMSLFYQAPHTSTSLANAQPPSLLKTEAQLINDIQSSPLTTEPHPSTGIYNPPSPHVKMNENLNRPYIQHSFVDWRDSKNIAFNIAQSLKNRNVPLMTIEPRGDESGERLLQHIIEGKSDAYLNRIAVIISASKTDVYIRFAHEMELEDLYTWGNQDPQLYINAYKHVVDYMKAHQADHAQFIWSPAGNIGAEVYYPGDEYVDIIGTTILYDQYWYGSYLPSFYELSAMREWLLDYNKPVWIVEFGAGSANPSYQENLIHESLEVYQEIGYQKFIYINTADANIIGPDYRIPDTLQQKILHAQN